jgi:Ca-activated chloride channel family protein
MERRHKVPLERFEWPLAAALIFLSLELLVGERKKRGAPPFVKMLQQKLGRGRGATAIILLVALSLNTKAYGSKGEEAFERGDYLQASEYYSQKLTDSPDDPELHYNFGTAAYKNNLYDNAIEAFTKALRSDNIKLQEMAYYNRGNSHYQKGAEMQQADPKATVDQWKQAVASLQSAIELDPDDLDARHNYEVVKKQLEELEKQLENQEEQQDQNQQDSQGQQQDEKQGNNGKSSSSGQEEDRQQSGSDEPKPGEEQSQKQPQSPQEEQASEQQELQPEDESDEAEKPGDAGGISPEDRNPEDQAKQDAMRQQLGKMTKEEAEQLLNALKNEEGELNFVPSGRDNNQNEIERDW